MNRRMFLTDVLAATAAWLLPKSLTKAEPHAEAKTERSTKLYGLWGEGYHLRIWYYPNNVYWCTSDLRIARCVLEIVVFMRSINPVLGPEKWEIKEIDDEEMAYFKKWGKWDAMLEAMKAREC